jgi:predicted RNase H-like HicB family nuclease
VKFSLELRHDSVAGLWMAQIPELAGVCTFANERTEALAKARAMAIAVVLERYFSEQDCENSARIICALIDLRHEEIACAGDERVRNVVN